MNVLFILKINTIVKKNKNVLTTLYNIELHLLADKLKVPYIYLPVKFITKGAHTTFKAPNSNSSYISIYVKEDDTWNTYLF